MGFVVANDGVLSGVGSGDMLASVYDANANSVADDSEALGGTAAAGYMLKTTYDANADGKVDTIDDGTF